jgi:hypothetical protein
MKSYDDGLDYIKALAGVNNFTTQEELNIRILFNRRFKRAYNAIDSWPRYLVSGEERFLGEVVITDILSTNEESFVVRYMNGAYRNIGIDNATSKTLYMKAEYADTISASAVGVGTSTQGMYYKDGSSGWTFSDITVTKTEDKKFDVTLSDTYVKEQYPAAVDLLDVDPTQFTTTQGDATLNFLSSVISEGQAVPYIQYPKANIGQFVRIYKDKPNVRKSSIEYDFYMEQAGAYPMNLIASPGSVFVTYKKEFKEFDLSNTTLRAKQQVPNEFFTYICYGTYADFLRFDGQLSKAIIEEDIAESILDTEMEKVDIMNNTNLNFKVQTHSTTQAR